MEDDREQTIKETLELLKGIKSFDDLKEHREEIIDSMIKMIKSALEILKSFLEGSISMSDEEKADGFEQFQDDSFMFTKEIEDELERLYELPGAEEYMDGFQQDVEEKLGPYMEEISQHMAKLAEEFMGDLMGGIAEGLAQGLGDVFGGEEGEDGENKLSAEPTEDEKLDVGQAIYSIQSLDDLKSNFEKIIKQIEDQLNADIYVMEYNKKMDPAVLNMIQDGLKRIEKRQKLLVRELDKEFERIGALPDAEEYAKEAKDKIWNQLEPLVKKINGLLKELKTE